MRVGVYLLGVIMDVLMDNAVIDLVSDDEEGLAPPKPVFLTASLPENTSLREYFDLLKASGAISSDYVDTLETSLAAMKVRPSRDEL
jgi:hypothetical protein